MKNPFRSIRIFTGETLAELRKATWPTRTELKDSTIVVVIAVIILGVFISIADFSLFQVVYLFTEWVTAARL
jgi:preprotein translocase subunit SecE